MVVPFPLTGPQRRLRDLAVQVAEAELRPRAAAIDREARFPTENFRALAAAGLLGLTVPEQDGGLGADLLGMVLVVEALARECPSTAMCYKMHLEALNPLVHYATPQQRERFLRPIARGGYLMTVAGNEGSGAGVTRSLARPVEGGFQVEQAQKAFVTSSHHADLFLFTAIHDDSTPPPPASAFIVERAGMTCTAAGVWDGLGLRGNDSCPMTFSGRIPQENLVGELAGFPAMRMRYAVVMYLSYAALYLGCAEGAFAEARRHVLERTYPATGAGLARVETVQRYFGEMQTSLDRTQALVYTVAQAADAGQVADMLPLMTAVLAADETALEVTQTAMTVGGGISYARRNALERYLRDARAAPVMAPVDDVTKLAIGRTVLGV